MRRVKELGKKEDGLKFARKRKYIKINLVLRLGVQVRAYIVVYLFSIQDS